MPTATRDSTRNWLRRLLACDEALAAGAEPAGLDADESPEMRARLKRGLACLHLLQQLRPQHTPNSQDALATERVPAAGAQPAGEIYHPAQIGRFEIRRLLGRGGFGVVYLAYDPVLCRDVALKIPRADVLVDAECRARFQREARAAAGLDHPNLVPVHEAGELGPVCYIALAYCPGDTLAQWLKQRTTPVACAPAARLVATLAQAIHYAHTRGVLHRDLKPSNVMLSPALPSALAGAPQDSGPWVPETGTGFLPRVTDFGLAKLDAGDGSQTRSGTILGTPAYMPPEQLEGRGRALGPPADVYALGAILFEVLTGRPPFWGETALATLQQVQTAELVSPSQLRPQLPRDLATICLKCLHKEPRRRYQTAEALADDLQRFLAGKPILARPVGSLERLGKWARRRPALATLAVVSVAAAAVLAIGTVLFTQEVQRENAKFLAEKLESDRQHAEAVKQTALAEQSKRDALAKSRLADERWHESRRHLFNLQLAQVAMLWERDPMRGLAYLEDEKLCPRELRGFAWGYYRNLCLPNLATFRGHNCGVVAVALSPDGKTLAAGTGASDVGVPIAPEIKLWDVPSGQVRAILAGHTDRVAGLAFSPDGKTLASGSWDKTVKLWDAASGKEKHTFEGHPAAVNAVAFSPKGPWLAASFGSLDAEGRHLAGGIQLWDLATSQAGKTLTGHSHWVEGVAFSPDGTTLASASGVWSGPMGHPVAGEAKLWSVSTGKELATFRDHKHRIHAVAFSPDGKTLACGSGDYTVSLWNVKTGQRSLLLEGHKGQVLAVAFLRKDLLATASSDFTVRLWDPATGQQRTVFRGHGSVVWSLACHPETNTLVSGSWDRTVKIWKHIDATAMEQTTLTQLPYFVNDLALSADNKLLAACSGRAVYLWNMPQGKSLGILPAKNKDTLAAAFVGDSTRLATACWEGTVKIWGGPPLRPQTTLEGKGPLACSADGLLLAFAGKDNAIVIAETSTGAVVASLPGTERALPLFALTFAPDGKTLVAGRLDGTIEFWDVASRQLRKSLKAHAARVSALACFGEGPTVISASHDETVKFWDLATGKELRTLRGHTGGVNAMALTHDGQTLATGSADKTILLWDVVTGQLQATLRGHGQAVTSLVFAHDSQMLISGSKDRTIKIWTVK